MSGLDEQNTPSLDDGSGAVAGFSFYRQAAKESKDRNPMGNPIWSPVWEARKAFIGQFYGRFHLNNRESTEAFIITEPHAVLVHRIMVGWITTKKGKAFPNREVVPCKAWTLDDKGRWIQTGKQCPLCIFLGREPRLAVIWALLDKREEQDPSNNRTTQWNLKHMVAESDDVREAVFNACAIAANDAGIAPTTRFAKFYVSRSENEKSSSFGNSWIFRKFFKEEEAMAISQVVYALEKLPPWSKTWPTFPSKTMVEMCKRHKEIFDQHKLDDFEGYSREGAVKVLGAAGAEITPPAATGGGPNAKPSLDDGPPGQIQTGPTLDDAAAKTVKVPNRPTLDDLANAERKAGTVPATQEKKTEPAKQDPAPQTKPKDPPASAPAPTPAQASAEEEDDWVPYNDEAL